MEADVRAGANKESASSPSCSFEYSYGIVYVPPTGTCPVLVATTRPSFFLRWRMSPSKSQSPLGERLTNTVMMTSWKPHNLTRCRSLKETAGTMCAHQIGQVVVGKKQKRTNKKKIIKTDQAEVPLSLAIPSSFRAINTAKSQDRPIENQYRATSREMQDRHRHHSVIIVR